MRAIFLAVVAATLVLSAAPAVAGAADVTPPVTTSDAPASWQRAAFTVRLTATDAESGVASTWYSLDAAASVAGSSVEIPAPADHSFDGTHTLSFYSVDVAGNTETPQTATLLVDTAAPAAEARSATGYTGRAVNLKYRVGDGLSPEADVTVTVMDAGGAVVEGLPAGTVSTGAWHRLRWTPKEEGTFTFGVAARDLAGNAAAGADSAEIDVVLLVRKIIGHSVQGRPIRATQFGSGARSVLIVGGVHGDETGIPVARQFAAYLLAHPEALPPGARIDVVPCDNPDGFAHHERGNMRHVDLNRNYPSHNWRRRLSSSNEPGRPDLSGGRRPGSEPETRALLVYMRQRFDAVVSLHSRAGILDCSGPGARRLGRRMSALCGFPVAKLWYDPYITGSMGLFVPERYHIPIVTVELLGAKLTTGMRRALLAAAR